MTQMLARGAVLARFGRAVALTVALGLAGCSSSTSQTDDAQVVPDPSVPAPTVGNSSPTTGETASSASAPSASAKPDAPAAAPAKTGGTSDRAEGWGTFKGQVVFGGDPPPVPVLEEKGKAEKDPQYCAKDASIHSERLIVDGASKGVKNVLVYFPKPSAVNDEAKSGKAGVDVLFDQVKCVFEPHVLGVQAGSKVTLKSSDEVNHNVNAKLQKNAPFNSVLTAGQTAVIEPRSLAAGERGPVSVTCDIHPWMQGWWLVLDNPYYAVTDARGNFEIKNAPAGTQKVVVWQEATGYVTKQSGDDLAIKAGGTTEKSWTIDPGKVKPAR